MDQIKIGMLLKELRKEKQLSQEQLAEQFNVSSRSVSRWENGNTMPDITLIIELADFYEIDIRELLSGERKSEKMDNELKETLVMVAEYTNAEKEKMSKEIITKVCYSAGIFGVLIVIHLFQLARLNEIFNSIAASLLAVGFIFSISSAIRIRQLEGKASKNAYKQFQMFAIIAGAVLLMLSILLLLWLVGII